MLDLHSFVSNKELWEANSTHSFNLLSRRQAPLILILAKKISFFYEH